MEKLTTSVFSLRNGSTKALVTSGMSFMSDSWIAWKPRMEDPSNIRPSVNASAANASTGMLKCCITPGRSQKRTSTNLTPCSRVKAMASSALLNMWCSSCGECRGPHGPDGDDASDVAFLLRHPNVSSMLRAADDDGAGPHVVQRAPVQTPHDGGDDEPQARGPDEHLERTGGPAVERTHPQTQERVPDRGAAGGHQEPRHDGEDAERGQRVVVQEAGGDRRREGPVDGQRDEAPPERCLGHGRVRGHPVSLSPSVTGSCHGQRPRMPLRSGRARSGSIPLGIGGREDCSARSRLETAATSALVSVGLSFWIVFTSFGRGVWPSSRPTWTRWMVTFGATRATFLRSPSSRRLTRWGGPSLMSTTPGRPTARKTTSWCRGSIATGCSSMFQPRRMVPSAEPAAPGVPSIRE